MEPAKRILDRIIEWVCVVLLAVMTILVTSQVIVGCFFNSPNVYTESLSKYMFVQMAIYNSAYMFGPREHMGIDFVRDHTPPKIRMVIEMPGELIVALFAAGAMIFGDYKQATSQTVQMDVALQVPMGTIYSAVPVSVCFILFYFVYNEMELVKRLRGI